MGTRRSVNEYDDVPEQAHEDARKTARNRSNKLGQGLGITVHSVDNPFTDFDQRQFWITGIFTGSKYSKRIESALTEFAMGKVFRPMPNMGKILVLVMHHKMVANLFVTDPKPSRLIRIIRTNITNDIAVVGYVGTIATDVPAHHLTVICTMDEASAMEQMLKESWKSKEAANG